MPDPDATVDPRPPLLLHQQGKEQASKRAQTDLRDIAMRRWDSATGGWGARTDAQNCITLGNGCQTYVTIGVPSPSMLRFLRIKRLAVIDAVELEFGPGLNVLTGETGAGKSILVEAVGLLLGGRASGDLVRTGAESATIEAIFEVAGEEIPVRREVTAQGRSRAFVNGELGYGRCAQGICRPA